MPESMLVLCEPLKISMHFAGLLAGCCVCRIYGDIWRRYCDDNFRNSRFFPTAISFKYLARLDALGTAVYIYIYNSL